MSVLSDSRGHEIIYINNEWVYNDTKETISNKRPCKRCNCYPTKEGYDKCIGYIKGVKSACCGHGVSKPYVLYE